MANKKTQHKQRKQRKQRTRRQRQRTQRRRHGGGMPAFSPAPVEYSLAGDSPAKLSLEQGGEFQGLTREYRGGAVFSGAPLTAADSATLDSPMAAAAGVTSLAKAFGEIRGMTDPGVVQPGQAGQAGGRRRKGRKGRKASRKGRKASRKGRKSNKHRKTHRRRQGGGGAFAENAATYVKDARDGMLLDNYNGAGLNREWAAVTGANGGDYMGPSV